VAATSFMAATSIGMAPALEAQAIASPAARVSKKNMLRMNVSPEVKATNGVPSQFLALGELAQDQEPRAVRRLEEKIGPESGAYNAVW
jgi:hypothetical protein